MFQFCLFTNVFILKCIYLECIFVYSELEHLFRHFNIYVWHPCNIKLASFITQQLFSSHSHCFCIFNHSLTDRWLKVWCIWYTYLKTLQECRSRRRIGWIGDVCVAFFIVPSRNKDVVALKRKKKAVVFTNVTTSTYQDQLNAGFSKVCEIFKVQYIIFKIHPKVSHEILLLWRHFHEPKHDAERNELWLVVRHVSHTASWAGLGQWKLKLP